MSPSAAVQNRFGWGRKAEPGELPELHRLSDIYWGFWFRGNNHLNAFKYYLAHHVVNPDTVKLITRALRNRRKFALTFWPGVAFTIGSPEHQAIIGKCDMSFSRRRVPKCLVLKTTILSSSSIPHWRDRCTLPHHAQALSRHQAHHKDQCFP